MDQFMKNKSEVKPPKLAEKFLESFCSYDFLPTALFDLEEMYREDLEKHGRRSADFRYWKRAISIVYHLYHKGKSQHSTNRIAMLKNDIILSFRNFKKDKAYSVINTLGLTLGFSAFILISLFVNHELSFDRFHKDHELIHRLSLIRVHPISGMTEFSGTSASAGTLIKDKIPEIQSLTRLISRRESVVKTEDMLLNEDGGYYAESTFFDFFNFPVVMGNAEGALDDPESILITESMAERYFGDENPIGETVTINKNDSYKVAAVIQDPPSNSQIQFQFLTPFVNWEKKQAGPWKRFGGLTFYKIDPSLVDLVLYKIDDLRNESFPNYYSDAWAEQRGHEPNQFALQPLADIHLRSRVVDEMSGTGDIRYMYIFSAIALVILIIACVNYTNSAVARSINRTKEVGVRKAIGASKAGLIKLYLSETFLYVLFSTLLSLFVIVAFLPHFNQFLGKELSLINVSIPFVLIILSIIFLVTFLSGIYPAIFLSRTSTVNALKGKLTKGRGSALKKGLITFQFLIAQALIIITIIIQSQLNFLQNKDIGYNREQLMYIPLRGELKQKHTAFKNDINAVSTVVSSAYADNLLGSGYMTAYPLNHFEGLEDEGNEMLWANYHGVGEGFIKTMGMEIIEGQDFKNSGQRGMMINETMAKALGWENSVGKTVKPQVGSPPRVTPFPILGVVKDFNDFSLKSEIKPMMMSISPDSVRKAYLIARLSPQNMKSTIGAIEDIWFNYVSDRPFDFKFYDDKFNEQYTTEMRLGKMIWAYAMLAIGLSILGILSISAFMVEQRMKEFSVRKVLGASVKQLTIMLNRSFFIPIFVAFVIAAPVTYYWAAERWLQSFAYRIEIQPWIFVFAIAGTLTLTFLTISYHSFKLKGANPTQYLGSD